MKVKEIMLAESLKTCTTQTKLLEAVKIMKDANIGALPILDDKKKVVGMVTDRDIALALAALKVPVADATIGDVVLLKLHSVNVDADLNEALKEMRTKKVGRLPVLDKEGKLKGLLSIHNLLMKSFNGQAELGDVKSKNESILKTIKSLHERYDTSKTSTKKIALLK